MIAVRLYREGRKSHIDTVFYKESIIFHLTNQQILEMVESDYQLNYKLTAVSPQWEG